MSRYERTLSPDVEQHASNLELFYDLVFVFAVTQVSHLLLHELTWRGAGRSLLVLLVVWWAWNYTTWVTNQLDPDAIAVRLLVLAIMLASLVMAIAIPHAFGSRAVLFAGAYVTIQLGRQCFLAFVVTDRGPAREPPLHIVVWFAAAGVFWIAGALVESPARIVLWLVALAIDYSAPLVLYRLPGRPKLDPSSWQVETSHFAERFQLFVIIALGESIVVTGATASASHIDTWAAVAIAVSFLGSAALWWLYFDYVASIAQRRLASSDHSGALARDAYTYVHVVLIAGIIVAAVGDAIVIEHPTATPTGPELAAIVGGTALYLAGHLLFRLRMAGSWSPQRLVALAAVLAAGVAGLVLSALATAALVLAVLVALIVWETRAGLRRRRQGGPTPLERLEARLADEPSG
jgi:low temperature requirement protein LtrA